MRSSDMNRWTYLEVGLDPVTGKVTYIDGREITDQQSAPPARQVRSQLGNEGWELVSVTPTTWLFKREITVAQQAVEQQWEYCCLTEDHAGGIRRGEWILVYYRADGNHVEHEHRRLGTALAQLGKNGWQMVGVSDPGKSEGYDNTSFFFARPILPSSSLPVSSPYQVQEGKDIL